MRICIASIEESLYLGSAEYRARIAKHGITHVSST
jgi:hypothetical protein